MIEIAEYLKNLKMVGQIHPTSVKDESEPIVALLVPVGTAIAEYENWSGQEITRLDFIKTLKTQGVLVFNSIDDFVKVRDNIKSIEKLTRKATKKFKRNLSEERRNQLKEHAKSIREKIRPSIS